MDWRTEYAALAEYVGDSHYLSNADDSTLYALNRAVEDTERAWARSQTQRRIIGTAVPLLVAQHVAESLGLQHYATGLGGGAGTSWSGVQAALDTLGTPSSVAPPRGGAGQIAITWTVAPARLIDGEDGTIRLFADPHRMPGNIRAVLADALSGWLDDG